jgi:ribosomal protein L7Ae-like RNA K-turn-binding protein
MLRASFDANWAPGENESVERFVRREIRGMILAADVDPEAWESAGSGS